MKQARLFFEHCKENHIKHGWRLLRRWSGQDISKRAAQLWYTLWKEGKLNSMIETTDEKFNSSFERRAQKKKTQRKISRETKSLTGVHYTGNADRTIRRKIADMATNITKLTHQSQFLNYSNEKRLWRA